MLLLRLAPRVGLGELAALAVEHALELGEIAAQRIELFRELLGRGLELANLDVAVLEREEVQELFAHGLPFYFVFQFQVGPPGLEPGTHRL